MCVKSIHLFEALVINCEVTLVDVLARGVITDMVGKEQALNSNDDRADAKTHIFQARYII